MVHAAVIGATGYAGCELLSILARHPAAKVTCLMSSGRDGKKAFAIEQSHPRLRGRFSVLCEPLNVEQVLTSESEVVFLATPHETSHDIVPRLLASGLRVVDLSGAFRLKDTAAYTRWYDFDHTATQALAEAVYGIPEFAAPAISRAKKIMRLAKPSMRPMAISTVIWPANPQMSGARAGAGRVALTSRAMSAPRARRNWTGKFWEEKTGKTASMALTRKKTMSQLVSSGIMGRYRTICGIFSIMAVANSIKVRSIQGMRTMSRPMMPRALGTKVRVCS